MVRDRGSPPSGGVSVSVWGASGGATSAGRAAQGTMRSMSDKDMTR